MHIKEVEIPIYFGSLIMIFTDQLESLNGIYNTDIKEEDYDAVVFTQVKDSSKIVLAIKKVDWPTIAHEVVHVVNNIFLSCGVQLDRHNDEPQAYLTGWVFNEIVEFLKEIKNDIKT